MSATAKQRKGLAAEREVADIWKAHGLEVRNLEYAGDHLVIASVDRGTPFPVPVTIHSEVKRQERNKMLEWMRQAQAEAPTGAIAVVSWRPNRCPWYSCLLTEDLAELVAR